MTICRLSGEIHRCSRVCRPESLVCDAVTYFAIQRINVENFESFLRAVADSGTWPSPRRRKSDPPMNIHVRFGSEAHVRAANVLSALATAKADFRKRPSLLTP